MFDELESLWNDENLRELSDLYNILDQDSAERLERSLDRTAIGYSIDLRTPLCDGHKGVPRSEAVASLEDAIGRCSIQEVEELDSVEKGKIGPYSIMLPWKERAEAARDYWHQTFNPDETALRDAVSIITGLIPKRSLRSTSPETAFKAMTKGTSLGLPYVTSDKSFAPRYLHLARLVRKPSDILPAIAYWRGQPRGENETPKQRLVWGSPHYETILGLTILNPVINALRERKGFSAWKRDVDVDAAMTRIIDSADGRPIISMDYKGFDASIPAELLHEADSVLSAWYADSGTDTVALLGEVANRLPLVTPDGIWGARNGGMPSGTACTNLRDTLVNLIAGVYAGIRAHSPLIDFEALGDDSVFLYKEGMDSEALCEYVSELGLESNPEKQYISQTSVHYLQRLHMNDYRKDGLCVGVRSVFRCLNGMLSYERFRNDWSKWLDTARWLMQIENCKHDPRFITYALWLRANDDILRSGVDPALVFKRAGGAERIRSILNISSFPFNVQDPSRVDDFEVTKILRSVS